MPVEFYLHFELNKLKKQVTNPDPWIDATSIEKYGDVIRDYLYDIASKAQKLQEQGWVFKMGNLLIVAKHDDLHDEESAVHSMRQCGIDVKRTSLIIGGGSFDCMP